MVRAVAIVLAVVLISGAARAQEYCVDRYNKDITNVNAQLGSLVVRQAQIDKRISQILLRTADIATEISKAALQSPPDTATIRMLSAGLGRLNREKTGLQSEGFRNQDRIVALKGRVPARLQGELRGCVEATAPANQLVNLAIQALAILSTGGASLTLPPKTLYVDMSAVLNGYPTGGRKSIINQARESALNAIGAGGRNNDLGKFVRDPGRVIRCIFGC